MIKNIAVIKDEQIKKGDQLHWYFNGRGERIIKKADQDFSPNCYAGENLNTQYAYLDQTIGAVFNTKSGERRISLICDICGKEETNPYDIGDECYCGGHFRPLLIQVHHQFKNTTKMCSQGAAHNHKKLIEETKINYPLPKNAVWMICNEKSEFFIKTTKPI